MNRSSPLLVIGAGPCGLSVGIAAKQHGLSCTILEKGAVVSTIAHYPTHMTFFSTADKLELGGVPFISAAEKPNRREALKYYQRIVRHFDLAVRQYENVVEIDGDHGHFDVTTVSKDDEHRYRTENVVIATGYFDTPCLLGIPGEQLPKVSHYYHEGSPYFDQDCLVIGGGNSAVDAALDLYRWGARVTLVHFAETLDSGVKPWILPDITNRINAGEIVARLRTRVLEVRPSSVVLRDETTGSVEELRNDWVFAMTGYRPDVRLLSSVGVDVDVKTGIPVHDPETMETNRAGVFIAGVIAAGYNANKIFIENGREHGERIVTAITARSRT
jgi:thioredoxin reductase (NADPH)